MKSYKLLAKITLDREYNKDDIVTENELGTYLNYFDSIGVLELVSEPDSESEVQEEVVLETDLNEVKVVLPVESVDEKPAKDFQKSKHSK